MNNSVVIVGTGLAGYTTAKEFRKHDPDSRLTLITADDGRAYSKPMLSTAYRKGQTPEDLVQADSEGMEEMLNAEIITGVDVRAIEPEAGRLVFDDGHLEYDQLVLAVGADTLPVPAQGPAMDQVYQVNDLTQYGRFRKVADRARRVLIIGGGLIGCEFANDMTEGGFAVDMVFPERQPLPNLLPADAGGVLASALTDLGVSIHAGRTVDRVERDGEGVLAVLSDGSSVQADVVLAAVGLRPRTALAADAGLTVDRGIAVDRWLRTSGSSIYALGDCAEVEGYNLCFVAPLTASARALGRTLAGDETAVRYPVMPVTVKTSCCQVVCWPPPAGVDGHWSMDGEGHDLRGEYRNDDGTLLGFLLMGQRIRERMALSGQMEPLIP